MKRVQCILPLLSGSWYLSDGRICIGPKHQEICEVFEENSYGYFLVGYNIQESYNRKRFIDLVSDKELNNYREKVKELNLVEIDKKELIGADCKIFI